MVENVQVIKIPGRANVSEGITGKENAETYLLDGVGEVIALVGRIDVDEDEIAQGGRHLHHHPLPLIVGIYPDSILRLQIESPHQTRGKLFRPAEQFLIAKRDSLVERVESSFGRVTLCDSAKGVSCRTSDGGAESRALHVGEGSSYSCHPFSGGAKESKPGDKWANSHHSRSFKLHKEVGSTLKYMPNKFVDSRQAKALLF